MYTVLLVDDEPIILEALAAAFHWNQFGVDTLLTAYDGCNALEIMSHQKVDLLIADCCMPNMDGLTLLKEVRAFYPDTHCIILTAYSEFEYVRTALQLGVDNYLLKPFVIEELRESIENALDNIYTSQKNSKLLFRKNLLLRWAKGSISRESLSEHCSLLDINLYLPEYLILCIQQKEDSVSLSNYCRICAEQLACLYEVQLFKDLEHRNIFIIGGSHLQSNQLVSFFEQNAAEMQLESFIALSVGNTVKSAYDLSESYHTACHLIESMDFSMPEMLILTSNNKRQIESDQLFHKINILFHQDEETIFQNDLQKLADELYFMTEVDSASSVHTVLTQSLERLFHENFPTQLEARKQLHHYIHPMPVSSNRDTFTNAVIDLLKNSHLLYRCYFKQFSPIVQSTIRYIHKHYAENISIPDFCTRHKLTPAYLGSLFRAETGYFANNYLTQHRIHCSIHLLINTNLSINDIAQKVGFSYSSYYISCFKKQFGVSPNKYRRSHVKE